MGILTRIADGVVNALSGIGTARDPRSYSGYTWRYFDDQEIEAAYLGSWLMRKGIDKPALEMVRERRDWQADADDIKLLEAEERRLDLWNKLKLAEIYRGLGGGAMVLWIAGDDPTQPINPDGIRQGSLRNIHVWHKARIFIAEMRTDPADEWYGLPQYYMLSAAAGQSQVQIHPSRVIPFRGDPTPCVNRYSWMEMFWGVSKVQTVIDAVQNSDTSQAGFAALIKDARNRRIGMPGLTDMVSTSRGEAILQARANAMAMGESLLGVTFFDSGDGSGKGGETIEDRQIAWTGMPDIMMSYLAIVAAAFDMPATVMLNKSPDGQNSTGTSDLAIWEKTVKARQGLDLKPCLDQFDAVFIPSVLGALKPDISWAFGPLSTLSEAEEANVFDKTMDALTKAEALHIMPDVAFVKAGQNLLVEREWMPGLDAALAELPDDERYGLDGGLEPEPIVDPNAVPEDPSKIVPIEGA